MLKKGVIVEFVHLSLLSLCYRPYPFVYFCFHLLFKKRNKSFFSFTLMCKTTSQSFFFFSFSVFVFKMEKKTRRRLFCFFCVLIIIVFLIQIVSSKNFNFKPFNCIYLIELFSTNRAYLFHWFIFM
jgi:hypothetical protein